MTPSQTRTLLDQLNHRPQKKRGQNFAIDNNIIRKSLDWAMLKPKDIIVEIGPGLGALTEGLLEREAIVFAVEKDPTLKKHLQERFKKKQLEQQFHLTEGDCLDFPNAALDSFFVNEPEKKNLEFKVVANLPYAITTPWLEKVLSGKLPTTMVLMLQRETAMRYLAEPGTKNFCPISIFLQSAYTKKKSHIVSARCFYPTPEVESMLLQLDRKPLPFCFCQETRNLIRLIFKQRRKQISAFLPEDPFLSSWFSLLQENGISLNIRAEAIPVKYWQDLDNLRNK